MSNNKKVGTHKGEYYADSKGNKYKIYTDSYGNKYIEISGRSFLI